MVFKYFIYAFLILSFTNCGQQTRHENNQAQNPRTNIVKLAKRFAIVRTTGLKWIYILGNRNNFDTTAKFLLAKDTNGLLDKYPNISIIQTPIKSVAALGSIYANMLDTLGALENLNGIDDMDYVGNWHIIQKFKKGEITELAKTPQIDIEKTMRLMPQLIFTFGMGEVGKDGDKKLELTKIPVVIIVDHLEESPLARAEWIKLVAAFLDKDEVAEKIFEATQKNYLALKQLASSAQSKPSVFTETKFGDVWYMPGGKSFMATLINDAAGHYLWNDNNKAGSLPLSFEQVYAKAKEADFWINTSQYKTKQELQQSENRYTAFKAFRTGNMFNNNLHLNAKGYSNYWETGLIFPDRILSDLIYILHPELKPKNKVTFNYYKQLLSD